MLLRCTPLILTFSPKGRRDRSVFESMENRVIASSESIRSLLKPPVGSKFKLPAMPVVGDFGTIIRLDPIDSRRRITYRCAFENIP
jgi:hypothetical protein